MQLFDPFCQVVIIFFVPIIWIKWRKGGLQIRNTEYQELLGTQILQQDQHLGLHIMQLRFVQLQGVLFASFPLIIGIFIAGVSGTNARRWGPHQQVVPGVEKGDAKAGQFGRGGGHHGRAGAMHFAIVHR